jgi:hypothetical protein
MYISVALTHLAAHFLSLVSAHELLPKENTPPPVVPLPSERRQIIYNEKIHY